LGVVVAGGIFLYLNYPDIAGFFTGRKQPVSQIKPIVKAKTDTAKKQSNLEIFFDSATNKKNALALSDSAANKQSNVRYYIIAGSFKTLVKAQQLAKQIEAEGYKNEVIHFDGSVYRISLGTYTDRSKAIEDLLKIRFTKGDDAVWLLTK
jgi:cell division protein FtsN